MATDKRAIKIQLDQLCAVAGKEDGAISEAFSSLNQKQPNQGHSLHVEEINS